jgi:hypothetical protein
VSKDALAGILAELETQSPSVLDSYLRGATRDATFNRQHGTTRFAQTANGWLDVIQAGLTALRRKSWRYQEGTRSVWVVETCGWFDSLPRPCASTSELCAWIRGYFDAEGGLPKQPSARFYIQLSQKDRNDLRLLQLSLEELGIRCGALHNPSRRVDPDYWRFYVRTASHAAFIQTIDSWHPVKRGIFKRRNAC